MTKKWLHILLFTLCVCAVLMPDAFAGPGTGGKLPYEDWVRQK